MEKKEREISEKKNNGPTCAVMVKYLVDSQLVVVKSEPLQLSLLLKCTFNLLYVQTELCQSKRKIEIHLPSGLVNFSFDLASLECYLQI